MRVADFDWLLMTAADAGLLIVLAIILVRRLHRSFPIFTTYVVYGVIEDLIGFFFMKRLPPRTYFEVYFTVNTLQSLLAFGVLFEIAVNVLRPIRGALPKGALYGFAAIGVLAGLVAWILSGHASQSALSATFRAFVTINVINASLAVTCFLAVALTAQLLGINWKNHVLQLTTGLAFYSLISLIVEMVQSHLSSTRLSPDRYAFEYHSLDQLRSISYLCAVAFWAWSFAKKEAPRKEFSPQMASFLVSISETAKRNRAALARSGHK